MPVDAISLEVFKNLFASATKAMGVTRRSGDVKRFAPLPSMLARQGHC